MRHVTVGIYKDLHGIFFCQLRNLVICVWFTTPARCGQTCSTTYFQAWPSQQMGDVKYVDTTLSLPIVAIMLQCTASFSVCFWCHWYWLLEFYVLAIFSLPMKVIVSSVALYRTLARTVWKGRLDFSHGLCSLNGRNTLGLRMGFCVWQSKVGRIGSCKIHEYTCSLRSLLRSRSWSTLSCSDCPGRKMLPAPLPSPRPPARKHSGVIAYITIAARLIQPPRLIQPN